MPLLQRLTNAFPLWVVGGAILAVLHPPLIGWFQKEWIAPGLAGIMLGMGLTLSLQDFKRICEHPTWVATGVTLQFTVMPALGFTLARLFNLPTDLAVGLILVSCCPGGTASNVISFLARANLALSVTMTAVSTVLAIILTPMLTSWLAGSRMDVNALGMLKTTATIVLIPIVVGVTINHLAPKTTRKLRDASSFLAVILITLIVAFILGAQRDALMQAALPMFGAILLLHIFGFTIGYIATRLLTRIEDVSRTVSIEVGMQNSGLGTALAKTHFAGNPLVALPCAVSALTHCILGSIVAAIWQRTPLENTANSQNPADTPQSP